MSAFQRYLRQADDGLPVHNQTLLQVDDKTVPFHEAPSFLLLNPWSRFFREVLLQWRDEMHFWGKDIRELGLGDARNLFSLGHTVGTVAGIDADPSMLLLASANIPQLDFPVDLYCGDAVAFVKQADEIWHGCVLLCLPQTPPQEHSENILVGTFQIDNPYLAPYRRWKESGMQLIAATLGELIQRAHQDLQVLLLLSGRIPVTERLDMIEQTGWTIQRIFATDETNIAQQSASVSIAYTKQYSATPEPLFWEKTPQGTFVPIDPIEAEHRRMVAYQRDDKDLNVYHHLYVYVLAPGTAYAA
jgi:hypothetical protein